LPLADDAKIAFHETGKRTSSKCWLNLSAVSPADSTGKTNQSEHFNMGWFFYVKISPLHF
jgi:hypothetical protein